MVRTQCSVQNTCGEENRSRVVRASGVSRYRRFERSGRTCNDSWYWTVGAVSPACLVALFHLDAYSHLYGVPFLRNAWLFVDFFFVLSGFVIAANYSNDCSTASA